MSFVLCCSESVSSDCGDNLISTSPIIVSSEDDKDDEKVGGTYVSNIKLFCGNHAYDNRKVTMLD